MKEKTTYTVEREYRGKITPEELVKRIVAIHRQDTQKRAG